MKNPLVRLHLTLIGLHRQLVEGGLAAGTVDPKVPARLAFLIQETDRLLTGQVSPSTVYHAAAATILNGTPIRFRCSDEGYTVVDLSVTGPPFARLKEGGPAAMDLWKQAGLPC